MLLHEYFEMFSIQLCIFDIMFAFIAHSFEKVLHFDVVI